MRGLSWSLYKDVIRLTVQEVGRQRLNQIGVLTPRGEEDLDGRVLQQVAPGEDGPDLGEVPFAVDVVTVPQHL